MKVKAEQECVSPVPEISITKTNAEPTRNVSSLCAVWQKLQPDQGNT